jgi:hypothetical protein
VRPRTPSIAAFWPALLGVLAAHQIAYVGHDDGHVHGYLAKVGPALVVAAVLGWIWSWARARVEFRSVVTMQVALFAVMEVAERLAAATAFSVSDLAPIGVALALIPLVAALAVLTERMVDVLHSTPCRPMAVIGELGAVGDLLAGPLQRHAATWSIRAPPALV